jgi:hypothetical protein
MDIEGPQSKILHFADLETKSDFVKLLEEGEGLNDCMWQYLRSSLATDSKAFEHLKNQTTSSIDFELQTLSLQVSIE